MQIFHYADHRNSDGSTTKKEALAREVLGLDWIVALQSEDTIVQTFADNLDDDYTLFCNVSLPEAPYDTDLILVGPKGVWVFEFFYTDGVYKADGERWMIYNKQEQKFKRCKPNPIAQASSNSHLLRSIFETQLGEKKIKPPWVSPAVILVNPHTRVQASESVTISLLTADQVYDVVARDLKKFDDMVSPEEAEAAIALITEIAKNTTPAIAQKKIFTKKEKRYRNISASQWAILFPIAVVLACIIIPFIIYLTYDNRAYIGIALQTFWQQIVITFGLNRR